MARRRKAVKWNTKVFVVKFLMFVVLAAVMIALFRVVGELVTAAKVVEMVGEFVSEALADAVEVVEERGV